MKQKVERFYEVSSGGQHADAAQRNGQRRAVQELSRWSGLALAAVFLAVVGISGCNDSTSVAHLRVLHASPDAPNVDINLDGKNVLTNVAYKTASDYLDVPAGTHTIKVYPTGTTNAVITASVPLTKNTYTTVAAINFVAKIEGKVITDDNTEPTSGNVKVRLIHFSPSAGSVDIYVTAPGADLSNATPTLTNVPFDTVSDYVSVPAGSYEVRVTPTTTKEVVVDSGTLALTAGQIRTGVALDNPGTNPPFTAIVLKDLN